MMGNKVKFVICGAQKSGTTTLCAYLNLHPEIQMLATKEAHFFDSDELFISSTVDYEPYHAMFGSALPGAVRGECTPIYMYWAPAPLRIKNYNPEMRLIVILRNPALRAYSHWNMQRSRGAEKREFMKAIAEEVAGGGEFGRNRETSYMERGFYARQISRLWELFGKRQVLVLRSEDLVETPNRVLCEVSRFLGIGDHVVSRPLHRHKGSYDSRIDREALHATSRFFAEEVAALEGILGWDLTRWRAYPAFLELERPTPD